MTEFLDRGERRDERAEPKVLYCADDGLDGSALPVLPSSHDAPCAALYGNDHDRRRAAWRPGAAPRLQFSRTSGGASTRWLRSGRACTMRTHRRGFWI